MGTRVGDRVKSLWELGLGTELSPCGRVRVGDRVKLGLG